MRRWRNAAESVQQEVTKRAMGAAQDRIGTHPPGITRVDAAQQTSYSQVGFADPQLRFKLSRRLAKRHSLN